MNAEACADAVYSGVLTGNFFFTMYRFKSDVLFISINLVALQAYDLDGVAGIRIPGAIICDASKESADQAINSVGSVSMDPSLGAQAANAGVQFARSLATKKVRLIQVAVPAGYQVLLKNIRR